MTAENLAMDRITHPGPTDPRHPLRAEILSLFTGGFM